MSSVVKVDPLRGYPLFCLSSVIRHLDRSLVASLSLVLYVRCTKVLVVAAHMEACGARRATRPLRMG